MKVENQNPYRNLFAHYQRKWMEKMQTVYCFEVGNLINFLIAHEESIGRWFVAIGTISLAFAAYKQISESRLQNRVAEHQKDLKQIFRDWNEELYNISQYKIPYLIDKPKYNIQENELFKDLKNHIPSLPEFRNFEKIWQECETKTTEIYQRQSEIINKIKTDVKITNFIGEFWNIDDNERRLRIKQDISKSVYLHAGCIVAGKNCEKNYSKKVRYSTDLLDLYYSHPSLKNEILLAENKGYKGFEPQKDHIKICEKVASEYKDDIKKNIDIEIELVELIKKMKSMLKMLIPYPEYAKMGSCKYTKQKRL